LHGVVLKYTVKMVSDNLREINRRINDACRRSGRGPGKIKLVCVTKEASLNNILEAIKGGIRDIGENRVQDAVIKYNRLKESNISWHMIGHLQRNKVKDALKIFGLIHSVDSLKLAIEINKEAVKQGKVVDVLAQVNTSGEASKFGIRPGEVLKLVEEITALSNVKLLGLMAMAPMAERSEESRPYYKKLKKIFDEINTKIPALKMKYLSMGMSQDFEIAIEEGANIVRIGRAIFDKGK